MPASPSLKFELSQAAALHNQTIRKAHNNSIHEYSLSQKGTFISFGSEFCPVKILDKLFCHHPNWLKLKKISTEGSNWPLSPITKKDRLLKNQELIVRGNHKSAFKYTEELQKSLEKEIKQGWIIPFSLS
jgi:hypothetical protein